MPSQARNHPQIVPKSPKYIPCLGGAGQVQTLPRPLTRMLVQQGWNRMRVSVSR